MVSTAAAIPAKLHGHSIGFNLAAIALGVAIGGLAVAYGIDAAGRRLHAASGQSADAMVARTLGSTVLTIPAGWFISDPATPESFAKQVDLEVALPLGPDGASRKIEISLTQRSRVRPSATLLDGVYLHQFKPDQLSGPPGLIGKPLEAQDGYEGETVWYDPISSSPFVAKCSAPIVDSAQGQCLRTVYVGPGVAAVYSFDADVLENWKKFDAELHPLLNRIGAL